ncbi:DUF4114 domain-containing protein [Aetokthonos hydrillicola Thurmond2011]|jgi:hypothetical protein|uniref:DUF4114 domain-containing protein n=1 Tax=Aetokthonos hydrillicola Thurmond2011 TaxID=2712845 RepID=A0AAP5IE84_9CYAN|nr:DUF4114 domain-containing protein [Aetokthonos hydrillicola]MBO3460743.1 DUF4114 domain-containing protein [Aetokthonos hydrillicola CCALA 1050]MBW4586398.1 DUF4114 domain-containing protein [Aetokthonos hydrillicola CCALA 1050]MDR9899896.1 DUF4114 domain-containing protein [Aetokthonos hydrillicola Thurmond2011]
MATVAIEKKQFTFDSSKYNSNQTLFKISDTDIARIKAGDLIIVDVLGGNPYGVYEGTHRLNPFYQSAENVANNYYYDFPFGSLVGTLDNGKTFFPIGNHLELTVLQQDGNLSLVFWGNDTSTNTNSVTLTVEVQRQKDLEQFNIPVEVSNYIFSDRWQFDVDAKANAIYPKLGVSPLLKTGLCLQPGDVITVDVHPLDFWSLGVGDSNLNFTTNGRRSDGTFWADLNILNHIFKFGSLVGTLDGGKTFFQVGTHLQMTSLNTGNFALACWDSSPDNNQGLVRAYIKVVRNGITITQPSNAIRQNINLGQFSNLPELSTKIPFDPNTCIWAKANCKIPPSLVGDPSGVIVTEPDKVYKLQITVDPGTASYKNTFGLFPVNADGSVAGVKPGDPSYAETAVRNRVKLPNYNEISLKQTFASELTGGTNYEIFLISNGTPDDFLTQDPKNQTTVPPKAYFRITAANPDKVSHVKYLSSDKFGFEDLYGGGDQNFNDLIVQLTVTSVESTTSSSTPAQTNTTVTENDCPLYPLCKLSQLNN